jgi:hypothetical protein
MALSPLPENVLPGGSDTLLTISGVGGFQYQARGLTQTLSVIKQAEQQVRTINGGLLDISNHAFRKYASKISCMDVDAPPLDNLFPGTIVTVDCAVNLCYLTGNPGSPARPEVSGSSYIRGAYTFYRPVLTMMVMAPSQSFDEWKADNSWELSLEEV